MPENDGAMIALYPPIEIAQALAIPGDECEDPEDLHVTLLFLGDIGGLTLDKASLLDDLVGTVSTVFAPVEASVSGVGRFVASESSEGLEPFYASVDSPSIPPLHAALVRALSSNGIPYSKDHGLSPHITLKYLQLGTLPPDVTIPRTPFTFDSLSLVLGDNRTDYQFTGGNRSMVDTGVLRAISRAATEHACRLSPPSDFQKDSFRRSVRKHEGKEYAVIFARPEGKTAMAQQAFRYPSGSWTAAEARAHCESHDGKFESVTERSGLVVDRSFLGPSVERYHDAYTEHLREFLRNKVSQEDFDEAVKFARAKAGGHASSEARKERERQKAEGDGLAKLVLGNPLSSLSVEELAAVGGRIPVE